MKIAMVSPWKVRCGIYMYTEKLTRALAKSGVETYIIRLPRFGTKTPEILENVAESIPSEADLIHVQHEYGLYQQLEEFFYRSLRRLGKPVVTTMHATGLRYDLDKAVSEGSDVIIVHNKFCQSRLEYSSEIIPHGCELAETNPREKSKRALMINPKNSTVGYLGFISNYKGLEALIKAMIPVNAELIVAGGWHTGDETDYITKLRDMTLKMLPDRCKWTGFVQDELLPTVYGAIDVFVYPSIFSTESGALLTALSHGKAVIASNLPPFKEKEEAGALTTFENVQDLTKKIENLLSNQGMREKLEKGARDYALRNSWYPNIAEKHIELYEKLRKK